MAKLIDGKLISAEVLDSVRERVEYLKSRGVEPSLAVIIVGDDPASRVYVNNKKKSCEKVGIKSLEFALPADTKQEELIALIDRLNADSSVSGILCQLPVPEHIDSEALIRRISPEKDVDCFHPQNVGAVVTGGNVFLPCTPAGIIEMLHHENIATAGKNCVIVGRSNIVGKPMAMLMLRENSTVTVCHSRTENLASFTSNADILIAAVGRAKMITADMVKPGAAVIDVGMNRDENGKLCGDVDFESVSKIAGAITPVPGGVGPMTVAMLMRNTAEAAAHQNNIR